MATPPSDGATPGSGIGPDIQYVYMFEENKRPTKQLDALLRAISHHIVCVLPVHALPSRSHTTPPVSRPMARPTACSSETTSTLTSIVSIPRCSKSATGPKDNLPQRNWPRFTRLLVAIMTVCDASFLPRDAASPPPHPFPPQPPPANKHWKLQRYSSTCPIRQYHTSGR